MKRDDLLNACLQRMPSALARVFLMREWLGQMRMIRRMLDRWKADPTRH